MDFDLVIIGFLPFRGVLVQIFYSCFSGLYICISLSDAFKTLS